MLFYILFFLFTSVSLVALIPSFSKIAAKGLHVDLNSPSYHDGILQTDKGGIIKGKGIFLQAQNIRYISRTSDGKEVNIIEATGSLFLKLQGKVYVGDKIEYDLDTNTGTIYNVSTESGPWYIDGERLFMKADGSSVIQECNVSTSENEQNDWSIQSSEVNLSKNATLRAKNVRFLVLRKPVLWLPSITKDLNKSSRSPIKYRFRYYGKHGPRLGMSYTFDAFENWENRLALDVSVTRGLGGGFTTTYKNPEHAAERFSAFNYYAYDIKTVDTYRRNRFRFQGEYLNKYYNDEIDFKAVYDRMSDENFPSDFTSQGLDDGRAGATEALFSKHHTDWIATLNTKVRINDFQSVKQQLPLLQYSTRPMLLGESGIVLDNKFSAGYLNYLYAHKTPDVKNFHSSRAELGQKIYRQFTAPSSVFTPYIGYKTIGYGNSPERDSKLLAVGSVGFEAHTRFIRSDSSFQQTLEPYLQYDFVTTPNIKPKEHFLFDFQDGIYRQNVLRFGARNFIRQRTRNSFTPQINFDLYARAFIDSHHIPQTIPRIYLDGTWKPTPWMQYILESAWHTGVNNVDHFNLRSDITVSENIAFGLEYRHRDQYAWRKVDPDNFMLDTFRSQKELLRSRVSERRDTFLARLFCRLSPNIAVEAKSRTGWDRKIAHHHAKSYNEYEFKLLLLLRKAFKVSIGFQRRVEGNRYLIDFSFGQEGPSGRPSFNKIRQGDNTLP